MMSYKKSARILKISIFTIVLAVLQSLFISSASADFAISPVSGREYRMWKFVETIDPGNTYTNTVRIFNLSEHDKVLSLKAVDAFTNSQGVIVFKKKGRVFPSWIKFETDQVELKSKESQLVKFTITVPTDATPGDYAGGITVSPATSSKETRESGANVVISVGLKIFITVPGDINPSLNLDKFLHDVDGKGDHVFRVQMTNTGNAHLKIEGDLELSPKFGEKENLQVNLGQLVSGQKATPTIRWKSDRIFNEVTAKLRIKYSPLFFTVQTEDPEQRIIERTIVIRIVNYKAIAGYASAVAMPIVIILVYVLWRRREAKNSIPYEVNEGDTLETVSIAFGSDAKKMIRVNGLKFPYAIHPGEIIKIPLSAEKIRDIREHPEKYNLLGSDQ